jgi:hypothetical protein
MDDICKPNKGVWHTPALPFTLKRYLKAKEELRKLKYFTMQKYNFQKILLKKKPKIRQDIITLYLLSSLKHKPKYHVSKILI